VRKFRSSQDVVKKGGGISEVPPPRKSEAGRQTA